MVNSNNLTLEHLNHALHLISRKPESANFVVHIDDMVETARMLRKQGFHIRRHKTVSGQPGSFFGVYGGVSLLGTLYVDIWRQIPRGKMLRFDIAKTHFQRNIWTG